MVSGSAVTLQTSQQAAQAYTVTVAGVHRASDGEALIATSVVFAAASRSMSRTPRR